MQKNDMEDQRLKRLREIAANGSKELSPFLNISAKGMLCRKNHEVLALELHSWVMRSNLRNRRTFAAAASCGVLVVLS